MRMIDYRPPGGEQQVRHRRHCSCITHFVLIKGLSHEMDLALMTWVPVRLTGKKYVNGSVNSEGHFKKFKTQARRFFRPTSIDIYFYFASQ